MTTFHITSGEIFLLMPIQQNLGTSNQHWKDSEDMLLSQCQVPMKKLAKTSNIMYKEN